MLLLALGFTAGRVGAQETGQQQEADQPTQPAAGQQMQLEVIVNGSPTKLIGAFIRLGDGRIAAKRGELEEIGLNPRGYASPEKLVVLDDLPGLSYKYEEATQRISIIAPDNLRKTQEYVVSNKPQEKIAVQSDYGAVLNYDLFANAVSHPNAQLFAFSGASATLDGRVFTPYGTLSQSAILRTLTDDSSNSRFDVLRLNTGFAYSDPETMITYRVGDAITGAHPWTRSVRLGGFQMQRNFGLRPDLVTLPLPAAVGSAAVPSTADIYINNVKTFSQDIGSGPYRLSNLPAVSGSGSARVVIRDASGRTTESNLPFYVSPNLLAPGLWDYSFEAGVPRLSYGTTADAYVATPVTAFSARYGAFDWLTLAGHAEGGAGLLNGSAGVVARTGSFGVATMAVAASHFGSDMGYQSYLAYETRVLGISLSASSQMTFGNYNDLASVTARLQTIKSTDPLGIGSFLNVASSANAVASSQVLSAQPPKALNRVSIGVPLFDKASLSASFIQSNDAAGVRSNIVSSTLSVGLPHNAALFATAFTNLTGNKSTGVLVGLSMSLADSVTASTSASGGTGGRSVNVEAAKPLGIKPGSFGWRVRDSEGQAAQRSGAVSYRSSFARAEAGISQDPKNGFLGTAEVEGAIATMGGGVFFGNRIDDSFAVVETGVPGVEVFRENRPVGVTDSKGRLLVSGLRSYEKNKIAIDTTTLPVDADIAVTQAEIVPADRSGVIANFAVKTNIRPAIVVLRKPDGTAVPVGSSGQVEGGEAFVVGYDGQAYIKGLASENKVTVSMLNGECHASFPYTPHADEQVTISDVICQ